MPYGVPQHISDYLRNSSGSLAIFAAIRRASLRVNFVVLCVIVLCVPVVRLGGNSLLLGAVKNPTPCRVGIAMLTPKVRNVVIHLIIFSPLALSAPLAPIGLRL